MVTEEKNLALPITITLFVSEVKVGRMADERTDIGDCRVAFATEKLL